MENAKIEKLYKLMERAHDEGDADAEAALRWAIYQLENLGGAAPKPPQGA